LEREEEKKKGVLMTHSYNLDSVSLYLGPMQKVGVGCQNMEVHSRAVKKLKSKKFLLFRIKK
jgi:hypothetical protein